MEGQRSSEPVPTVSRGITELETVSWSVHNHQPVTSGNAVVLRPDGEQSPQPFQVVGLSQKHDPITGSKLQRTTGPGRRAIPDHDRDPRMLAKWKVADRTAGGSGAGTDLEFVRRLRFVAEPD